MPNESNQCIANKQVSSTPSNILAEIHSLLYAPQFPSTVADATLPDSPSATVSPLSIEIADCKTEMEMIRSIAPRHSTMPILGNVLVCIENSEISLKATDIETAIEIHLQGRSTFPHGKRYEFLVPVGKHLWQKSLKIEITGPDQIFVNGSRIHSDRDPDEFPTVHQPGSECNIMHLSRIDAQRAYQTRNFTASDKLKYAIMGICFTPTEFYATDDHIGAIRPYRGTFIHFDSENDGNQQSCILPTTIFRLYPKISKLSRADAWALHTGKTWAWWIISENITLSTRIINECFPDIHGVIPKPKDAKFTASIEADEFRKLLKSLAPGFTDGKNNRIIFQNEYMTTIRAVNDQDITQVWQNQTAFQPVLATMFSYQLLRDIAAVLDGPVDIFWYSPVSALLFENNDDLFLIMPIRFEN